MIAKRAIPLWIAIFLLAGILIGPREFSAGDTQRYVGMAVGETVVAPFAYRALVPAIVRALPVDVESGFLITTIVFSYLTLIFFHRLLRRLGVAERAALLTWGRLVADLEGKGRPLPAVDSLIAALALRHDLVLVTRNEKDFEGVGITITNPWK